MRLAVLIVVAGACAEAPSFESRAQPITHGEIDDLDLAVVALLTRGAPFCTGTLISSTVVVTAAHCLAVGPDAIYIGADPAADAGVVIEVADTRVHPAYDPSLEQNDVAVLLLREAAPAGVVPAVLPDVALDASAVGATLRLVGFGWTSGATEPLRKRQGLALVSEVSATSFRLAPAPSQTCHGDSGGPAFATLDGVERLVGVTSGGDRMCAGYGIDVNLGAFVDDLVRPYLAATAAGAAAPGERCFGPETCREGACVAALDDGHPYCSVPCASDEACPSSMHCEPAEDGSWCRHPTPGPGAIGAACEQGWDCVSGLCTASADGDVACATPCAWDGECGVGESCRSLSAGAPRSCQPDPTSGGCAATRRPSPWLALVWLLLVIHPRRCRRRRSIPPGCVR